MGDGVEDIPGLHNVSFAIVSSSQFHPEALAFAKIGCNPRERSKFR